MARKDEAKAPADYAVGRGKPPRNAQFKKGQSGNPGGRKKGSRNFKTILQSVLDSEIELTENGQKRKVPLIEAILFRQVQDALRGQPRAIENLIDRYERHAGQEVQRPEELADDDLALLDRVLRSKRRMNASEGSRRAGAPDRKRGGETDHD